MGEIEIIKVSGRQLIKTVALLAEEIWTEHFTAIIGKGQGDYMLAKFQSEEAISRQIENEGFLYYLLKDDGGEYVGYAGIVPDENGRELFLSKLYIKRDKRRQGYAKKAMRFIEDYARQNGLAKIILTVNKNNAIAIEAYRRMGFESTGSIVTDIGGGFVMDDYRMEKRIEGIKRCSG
jgi:ribosomal protein S18 acetylase RimI-like enzyme